MKKRYPWTLWLGIGAVIIGYACQPTVVTRAYDEDFEGELCDGVPCGWERATGTAEQASWVETIHPGEHGLRLAGEVSVRGPGSDAVLFGPNVQFRMTSRCDPLSHLTVEVIIVDLLGTRPLVVPGDDTEEWSRTSVTLGSGGGDISNSQIVAIAIRKTGPGVCEIGDLLIDEFGFGADLECS